MGGEIKWRKKGRAKEEAREGGPMIALGSDRLPATLGGLAFRIFTFPKFKTSKIFHPLPTTQKMNKRASPSQNTRIQNPGTIGNSLFTPKVKENK